MIKKVKQLRDLTGMNLTTCKHAILFAEKNKDCTAIGYCKALSLALNISMSSAAHKIPQTAIMIYYKENKND